MKAIINICIILAIQLHLINAQSPLPGAGSFGMDTKGGKGGEIIRVTNLDKEGPGSLREALQSDRPRIVVFEVAGVIDLQGSSLNISDPFITIAGQTAPSPGITLIKGGLKIRTHDVIVQHLKVTPGQPANRKKSGWEVDGISSSEGAYNVIVDHCSLTWATDENLSASGPRFEGKGVEEWRRSTSHRIVFSNCIIAEGLSNSTHAKGEHSKGSLIHDNTTEILLMGNLFANNMARNPFCKGGTQVAILNNYIYNPGTAAIHYELKKKEWRRREPVTGIIVVAGNSICFGKDTREGVPAASFRGPVEVFWKDNLNEGENRPGEISGVITVLDKTPFWPGDYKLKPAEMVKEYVLENAGAFPWDRDEIDRRIIADIKNGKGRIIDSEKEVGGYPEYEPAYRTFNMEEWNLNTLIRK